MRKIRTIATIITFAFFSVVFFGCDQKTTTIDLSNIESITINFETNSDSAMSSIVINQALINSIDVDAINDVKLEDLSYLNPEKDGFLFGNWYFDEALKQEVSENSPILSEYLELLEVDSLELEITLYASWERLYTVTYHLDGGTNVSTNPLSFTETDSFNLSNPSKEGYTFLGWYDNEEFNESPLTEIPVGTTSNIDLYALWEEIQVVPYTITYELDGGTNSTLNPATLNGNIDIHLYEPVKEGFRFVGWFSDDSFTMQIRDIPSSVTNDVTLYAKWKILYTISYHLDGGSNDTMNPSSYTENDNFSLNNPYKEGYTFLGWYNNEEFNESPLTEIPLGTTSNLDLYALWEVADTNIFTITYHLDGGTNESMNPTSFTADYYVTIYDPYKEGYTFLGWFNNASFTGSPQYVIPAGTTSNVDLYALWEESQVGKVYTITYELDGGTNSELNPATFNGDVDIYLYEPVKIGFEFDGWYIDDDFTSQVFIIPTIIDFDVTLYAKWEEIVVVETYTITYVLDGGTNNASNPASFNSNNDVSLFNPEKESAVFIGWFMDSEFVNQVSTISTKTISENITLYAKWEENNYPLYLDYIEYDTYVAISGINQEIADVVIPDTYHGKPVTTIEENAFYWKLFIVSVTLPETITTIEEDAFAICHQLTTINFPSSLTSIGQGAFYSCGFTSLDLPNTITYFGEAVFGENSDLVSVVLPENMTVIKKEMFLDCDMLETINIPASVTEIQKAAFAGCLVLTNVNLENVNVIGENAFTNCQSFTEIIFSDNLTIIDKYAFAYNRLVTTIVLPENLVLINDSAFSGCYGLESIELPSKLEYIGEGAFWGCHLKSIRFPDSLKVIGEESFRYNDFTEIYLPKNLEKIELLAFRYCEDLVSIYLPSSIDMVEARVFRDTSSQATIYMYTDEAPSSWEVEWKDYFYGTFFYEYNFEIYNVIYHLDGGTNSLNNPTRIDTCNYIVLEQPTKAGYNFEGWYSEDTFTTPITKIAQGTNDDITLYAKWSIQSDNQYDIVYRLDGGLNLSTAPMYYDGTEVVQLIDPTRPGWLFKGWYSDSTFMNQVTEISTTETGDVELFALWEQYYLVFEEFDDYVAVVGLYQPLSVVDIPSSYNGKPITTLAKNCFASEKTILEIILPDTITTIEDYALNCPNLKSINLPEGLLTLGNSVFSGCEEIKEITIPSTVTSFGEYMFTHMDALEVVTFNNQMTILPEGTFYYNLSLTTIVINEGITEIGNEVFRYCSKLENVTLPDSLLKIGRYAFDETPLLTSIILPEGLIEISACAFFESGLTSIVLPDSLTTLGEEAFRYCYDLRTITIGSGLETVFVYNDFIGLHSLYQIIVSEDNLLYESVDGVLFKNQPVYTLVKYPEAKVLAEYTIPNNVIEIASSAFSRSDLLNINISDSVVTIGGNAFYGCKYLRTLYISSNVIDMGSYIVNDDEHISVFVEYGAVPDSWSSYWVSSNVVVYWGISKDNLKVYNNQFEYIMIDNHIEIIRFNLDDSLYFDCDIPSTIDGVPVTTIHSYALYKESGLIIGNILIPSTVTTIGYKAFTGSDYNSIVEIYCEADSKPVGWDASWNKARSTVQWSSILFKMDTQGGTYQFPIVGTLENLEPIGRGWTPTRDGFIFDGWYTTPECTEGTEFTFTQLPSAVDIMPAENTTIYAKWIPEL